MKRPVQHEIDEAAQLAFRLSLLGVCVVREQRPDYGIDYMVEMTAGGQTTGQFFVVQLKGKQKVCLSGGEIRFSLSSKHLAEYVDQCRLPVFLVVVDTATKRCYWLFLQQYALEQLAHRSWRKQSQVTVVIPEDQEVCDHDRFRSAVNAAEQYMNALNPAAIATAVQTEKKRLESLDPRFSVSVQVDGDQIHYQLNAKEKVPIEICFEGDPERAQRAIRDLIERGQVVDLSGVNVRFEGTPALSKVVREIVSIQHQRMIEARLDLYALEGDREVVRLDSIVGILAGGQKEARFTGRLPEAPLAVEFPFVYGLRENFPINCGFEMTAWIGKPIRSLAYFDSLYAFFDAAQRDSFMFRFSIRGRRLFSMRGKGSAVPFIRQIAQQLAYFHQARAVARVCDVHPVMPESITRDDLETIDDAYWRLVSQGDRLPCENIEFSMEIGCQEAERCLRRESTSQGGELKITCGPEEVLLFGTPIQLPPAEVVLTKARLGDSHQSIMAAIADSSDGFVSLLWKGVPGSELIRRPLLP